MKLLKIQHTKYKTKYFRKKQSWVESKIPKNSGLVNTTVLNTSISEVENKIPNHDKYITTPEFN